MTPKTRPRAEHLPRFAFGKPDDRLSSYARLRADLPPLEARVWHDVCQSEIEARGVGKGKRPPQLDTALLFDRYFKPNTGIT